VQLRAFSCEERQKTKAGAVPSQALPQKRSPAARLFGWVGLSSACTERVWQPCAAPPSGHTACDASLPLRPHP